MVVPKTKKTTTVSNVIQVHIDKPILIPRLPVVTTNKQRVKLITKMEKYSRRSMEYKNLISYLRKYVDMDECTFMSNFKAGKKRGMIEIHHAPYNLFTITDIVAKRQEEEFGYIDELRVVDEVMRLHYMGLIGLVPLSITCHQLVHDDKLTIPLWCVYGRFVEFTEKYYKWIPEEMIVSLEEAVKESVRYQQHPLELQQKNGIINVQYVYLDVEGETDLRAYLEGQNAAPALA